MGNVDLSPCELWNVAQTTAQLGGPLKQRPNVTYSVTGTSNLPRSYMTLSLERETISEEHFETKPKQDSPGRGNEKDMLKRQMLIRTRADAPGDGPNGILGGCSGATKILPALRTNSWQSLPYAVARMKKPSRFQTWPTSSKRACETTRNWGNAQ